jgi:DNA-binding CsgD family transcriptional regulator
MRIDNSLPQPVSSSRLPRALATIVDSIGTRDLPDALLDSLEALWGIRFVAVYGFDLHHSQTRFLLGASRDPSVRVQQNATEYALYYAADDPARQAVVSALRADPCTTAIISTCLAREELSRPGHKHLIERAGVLDRFACFFSADAACWFGLHVMRGATCGPLTEQDFAELRDYAFVYRSLINRHIAITGHGSGGAPERIRHWLQGSGAGLSARELEVCTRLLAGESQPQIAGSLGIKESSVQSYRKRAYEKLGVREMREIFLRILESPESSRRVNGRLELDRRE